MVLLLSFLFLFLKNNNLILSDSGGLNLGTLIRSFVTDLFFFLIAPIGFIFLSITLQFKINKTFRFFLCPCIELKRLDLGMMASDLHAYDVSTFLLSVPIL